MQDDPRAVIDVTVPAYIISFAERLMSDPDMNASRAAEAVGKPGQAKALLADRRTQMCLASIGGELRDSYRSMRHAMVGLVAKLCIYDVADAFTHIGTPKLIHDVPVELRAAIQGIKTRPDGSMEYKFVSRLEALKLFFTLFGDIAQEQNVTSASGTARVVFLGAEQVEE